jgi:hypothetical protein
LQSSRYPLALLCCSLALLLLSSCCPLTHQLFALQLGLMPGHCLLDAFVLVGDHPEYECCIWYNTSCVRGPLPLPPSDRSPSLSLACAFARTQWLMSVDNASALTAGWRHQREERSALRADKVSPYVHHCFPVSPSNSALHVQDSNLAPTFLLAALCSISSCPAQTVRKR